MRSMIKIGSFDVALTQRQVDALLELLSDAVYVKNEYIGSNKGDDGTAYKKLVRKIPLDEGLEVKLIADEYIDTLLFKTKLHDEAASSK
jgi:hypothetical protein